MVFFASSSVGIVSLKYIDTKYIMSCKGTQNPRIIVINFSFFSFGGVILDRHYAGMLILPNQQGKDTAIKISACR